MAAPTVASTSTASAGYGTSVGINTPSGAATGDLLIAAVAVGGGGYWVESTGWSWVNSRLHYNADIEILWRYHDGSSSSYTFSGWSYKTAAGGIARITGADPVRPIGGTGVVTPAPDFSAPYEIVYPSLYAPLANSLLLTFAAQQFGAGQSAPTFTAPSGMTEQWDFGSNDATYPNIAQTMDSLTVAAGATGTKTGQTSGSIFPGYSGDTVGINLLIHGPRTTAKKFLGVRLR